MNLLDFWPTAAAINKCVPSEAEVISDEAFLAVHQPIRLVRRSLTNTNAPLEATDERRVLDALLTPNLPEGYVIVPIVGPSGVGKSHLIRWLGLHLPRHLHVIPIPKSTSLRRILESILKGLEGPGYDDIRKQLTTAREALDEIAARNLLLAHFRTALERRVVAADAECKAAVKRNEKPPVDLVAVAQTRGPGLVALLEGPTKDALLEDTAKRKSVFRALVRRVTTGVIDAEHGQFVPDDFEFKNVSLSKITNEKLRNYVEKLKGNTQKDREAAAALMNDVRDGAVGQLLGLGENQLADLFRRVREELFKDNKELVLLIEDFTTLAGVQQGLLDVIKMEGVRAGEAERCTLRTALAVTDGYLSPYDTLKTRVGYEFVLSEQPASEPELLATITDLVGAYLNAARLGPDRLRHWYDSKNRNPDAAPPSFESAAAALNAPDRTALEAFDKSTRGHSLFPFNRLAVKQLAYQHLASSDPLRPGSERTLRLNPRALIKEVLHTTLLNDRETFERGEFPPETFHKFDPNKLGPDITHWLTTARRADFPRYAVLLGYWADCPRNKDAVRLQGAVYTAFRLVPLTDTVPEPPPPPPPPIGGGSTSPPPPPPVVDKEREAAEARERTLDIWAKDRKITNQDAVTLRNDLLDMIDAAVDWDAELVSVPRDLSAKPGKARSLGEGEDDSPDDFTETGPAAGVKYPRASLRTAVGANEVYLPFCRTGIETPNEAIFALCDEGTFADQAAFAAVRLQVRALIRFHTYKTFDYDGGDDDRGWYAALCERAVRQAVPFLRKKYERVPDSDGAAVAVAQALYVSARALNLEGAHSNQDAEVLNAVLHAGPGGLPVGKQDDGWHKFRQACAANRAVARDFLLRRLTARQGNGNVLYGIDAHRLLEALKPVRKSCRVETEFPGKPDQLDDNARQVRGFVSELGTVRTDAAVAGRRTTLERWANETRVWLGTPFDKKPFVAECLELLTQSKNLGVFRADVTYETLRGYTKAFEEAAVSEAITAVDRLKEDAAPGVVLTAVVQAPDGAMETADTFRTAFQAFVQQTHSAAVEQIGKTLKPLGASETADPDTLLPTEAQALDADLRTLLAAVGADAEPAPASEAAAPGTDPAAVVPVGRFATLRTALERLSRVDTVAQQLKELEPVRFAVSGWADQLPRLVTQHQLFAARTDVTIDAAPDGKKVASAAAVARAKLAASPLEVTRGRTFANLQSAMTKVTEGYQAAIDAAWLAWVQNSAPKIDDAELVPFELHPEYKPTVAEIRAKRFTLKRHEKEPAANAEEFAQVEQVIAALRVRLGHLPTDAPEEVKRFLAATNTKDGASLDLLTDAVVKWLRDKNQFDKYRIRR